MTDLLEKTVVCIRCGTEHEAVPAQRNGFDKDGNPKVAVWAKDYTYYKDNYKHKGFGVLCNRHERDAISNVTEKEISKSYDYDQYAE